MQKRPHGATPMRGKIAAVKGNFRNVEIDLCDSTPLSLDADILIKARG